LRLSADFESRDQAGAFSSFSGLAAVTSAVWNIPKVLNKHNDWSIQNGRQDVCISTSHPHFESIYFTEKNVFWDVFGHLFLLITTTLAALEHVHAKGSQ